MEHREGAKEQGKTAQHSRRGWLGQAPSQLLHALGSQGCSYEAFVPKHSGIYSATAHQVQDPSPGH